MHNFMLVHVSRCSEPTQMLSQLSYTVTQHMTHAHFYFVLQSCTNCSYWPLMLTRSSTFIRPQQEESNLRPFRPHLKTSGGGSEGQTGAQRLQNHQGPHGQAFQGSHIHTSPGPHSQVFQEQNQDFHISHIQSTPGPPSSQEWRDPSTSVHSRGDRSRYSIEGWLVV